MAAVPAPRPSRMPSTRHDGVMSSSTGAAADRDDPLADHDAAIVVMCDNGLRSGIAARQLREQGLLAESLAGGLRAWAKDGNPVLPGPYRRRR